MHLRTQQNPPPQNNRRMRKTPKKTDDSNKKSTANSVTSICNRLIKKEKAGGQAPCFFYVDSNALDYKVILNMAGKVVAVVTI